MPNRWIRDVNNVLQIKGTVGGLVDGTVINADIAAGSIQANKLDFFKSAPITGNGSEQDTAHGLNRTPTLVLVFTQDMGAVADINIVEGTHDGTDCKVTVETGVIYTIFAL